MGDLRDYHEPMRRWPVARRSPPGLGIALACALTVALTAPTAASMPKTGDVRPPTMAQATPGAGRIVVPAAPSCPATRWIPAQGATWQWQLSGTPDLTVDAAVFDLDVDETSSSTVRRLHAAGRHVICYVDVGTWESYRQDAWKYPRRVLGRRVVGWPGERWLDIRQIRALAPILRARLDRCVHKGFDAVEPDWLDAYDQPTGFPITRADSLRFDRWIAHEAHIRGLSIAQKNAPGLAADLQGTFDFALVEQCFQYRECGAYRPYLRAGAAVLDAEYALDPPSFCASAARLGISAIRKRLALDAWRRTCPPATTTVATEVEGLPR